MACYHPLPAWKAKGGRITLDRRAAVGLVPLQLPCGGCLGCRAANAKAWTFRCKLELQNHRNAVFTNLTYHADHVPKTLQPRHLQLFLKKLRRNLAEPIKFFASGEYGEKYGRPHYHAILYGPSMAHAQVIEHTWGLGHTRTYPVTPRRIAYVAGYCQKKIAWKREKEERIDPETGEVYEWQPPFFQMSRNPGIAGAQRALHESWRLYAIDDGTRIPVPRYLHEAWKQQATEQEKEELIAEKSKLSLSRDKTPERLAAAEQIAITRHQHTSARRIYE